MNSGPVETDVLVVGAGPVGSTIALDLAQRGVGVIVAEADPNPRKLPKMERCNARTMEIFRRLGVAEALREASAFTPQPMDVFVAADTRHDALLHLRYPSVPEAKELARQCDDGTVPFEPQQLVSQYTVEPILRGAAVAAGADVRTGAELIAFEQDDDGVTSELRLHAGGSVTVRSRWLVGADGGRSAVRKQLGIAHQGDGRIRSVRQVFFRSRTLFANMPFGPARHYYFVSGALIVQDDLEHFVVNFMDWKDGDRAVDRLKNLLGDVLDEVEVLHEGDWHHHLLVADRYRDRRVFIAGDAAHLVIPQGGLGMNTGIGDAVDISWKLAAAAKGYAGEYLLASYEDERREIGLFNREASRAAAQGVRRWRAAAGDEFTEDSPAGEQNRREVAQLAADGQPIGHELAGTEMSYRYSQSPIVITEPGSPENHVRRYTPGAYPGVRLPHMWLHDGRPIQDALGPDYTLLDVGATATDTDALEQAFLRVGAPLTVLRVPDARLQGAYDRALVLVRPDLHVVWRGDTLPEDADTLAGVATGRVDARNQRLATV